MGENLSENVESSTPENSAAAPNPRPAAQYGQAWQPGVDPEPVWDPELAWKYESPAPARPAEDVLRGTIFALAALPVGVILWMVIWSLGFLASIVSFAAAFLAAKLYVAGARSLGRRGAWVVAGVTASTILVSFGGGVWLDAVAYLGGEPWTMVMDPEPFALIEYNFYNNPDFMGGYLKDFLMALLFGGLGCFFTLRQLFAATRK